MIRPYQSNIQASPSFVIFTLKQKSGKSRIIHHILHAMAMLFGKSWIVHLDLIPSSPVWLQPHTHTCRSIDSLFHNCSIVARLPHNVLTMICKQTEQAGFVHPYSSHHLNLFDHLHFKSLFPFHLGCSQPQIIFFLSLEGKKWLYLAHQISCSGDAPTNSMYRFLTSPLHSI